MITEEKLSLRVKDITVMNHAIGLYGKDMSQRDIALKLVGNDKGWKLEDDATSFELKTLLPREQYFIEVQDPDRVTWNVEFDEGTRIEEEFECVFNKSEPSSPLYDKITCTKLIPQWQQEWKNS